MMKKSHNYISQIRIIGAVILLLCFQAYKAAAQASCVSTDYDTKGSITEMFGQSFTIDNCAGAIFHSIEIEKADSAAYSGSLAIYNGESTGSTSLMYYQSDVNISGYGFQTIFLNISEGQLYFAHNNTYTFVFSGFKGDFSFNYSGTNSYKGGKAYLNGFNSQIDISFKINTIDGEVLPVTLASFNAHENIEGDIDLSWATASELNNAGFEVQHSLDAKNFETVGWVSGSGTSTKYQTYSFTALAQPGKNYYRLKQVDHDGRQTYSKPVMISPTTQYKIGPNPTSGIVRIQFNSDAVKQVKVFNATGDLVSTQSLTEGHQIDLTAQPAGIYVVQIMANQERIEQRIIKM